MKNLTPLNSESFDKKLLNIPIKPKYENIVSLKVLFKHADVPIIFTTPQNSIYYLRESVANSLVDAAKYFSKLGFKMKIESAYRSLSMQIGRFKIRYESFKKNNPEKTKGELLLMANTYTAGIPLLAAHCAGAAVDVTLIDKKGKPVDFGVPYPHGGPESLTVFPNFPERVKKNRALLKMVMEKFGFINYPFEYWHYSIGDVCAAYIKGEKHAMYEPVEYNPKTGKITKYKCNYNVFFKIE